jgi:hypothetical protein
MILKLTTLQRKSFNRLLKQFTILTQKLKNSCCLPRQWANRKSARSAIVGALDFHEGAGNNYIFAPKARAPFQYLQSKNTPVGGRDFYSESTFMQVLVTPNAVKQSLSYGLPRLRLAVTMAFLVIAFAMTQFMDHRGSPSLVMTCDAA